MYENTVGVQVSETNLTTHAPWEPVPACVDAT